MRLSHLHRIAVGFVAAVFWIGGADHWFGFDPCPHHDAAFISADGSGSEVGDHHAHHGGSSDESESDSGDHGPCDCIGPCAVPSPTALPATESFAIAGTLEYLTVSVSRPRDFVPPQVVPFLLPYAHAPPSLG